MLPALELVSTVKVLSLYAQCSNLRVKMLTKFTLCLMDFSLHDSCILDLSDEEIEYYKSQLTEAMAKGSTSHWYTYQELLQLLVYFIRNNSKHFPIFLNAIFDLLMEAVESDVINVVREFQKVVVNLCTRPLYKQLSSMQLSQVDKRINLLCSHEDPTIKDSAMYIKLIVGNVFEGKFIYCCNHVLYILCNKNIYYNLLYTCCIIIFHMVVLYITDCKDFSSITLKLVPNFPLYNSLVGITKLKKILPE